MLDAPRRPSRSWRASTHPCCHHDVVTSKRQGVPLLRCARRCYRRGVLTSTEPRPTPRTWAPRSFLRRAPRTSRPRRPDRGRTGGRSALRRSPRAARPPACSRRRTGGGARPRSRTRPPASRRPRRRRTHGGSSAARGPPPANRRLGALRCHRNARSIPRAARWPSRASASAARYSAARYVARPLLGELTERVAVALHVVTAGLDRLRELRIEARQANAVVGAHDEEGVARSDAELLQDVLPEDD